MSSNKIVLTSSGGESFEVDKAVAREFQTVAHMIDNDCADKPIPLTNVSSKDLALVIEYCKTHVEAGVSLEEEDKDDVNKQVVEADVSVEGEEEMKAKKTMLKAWDAEFMKEQDLETMFQLILAAKYLNVQGLVHLVCQKVADHLQDKTPEEFRKIFSIENDYTPEEEAAVRKENSWAFE